MNWKRNESKMNAEGLDTLAPFFGLFTLFFIGSCFICACHRRCCPNKVDKKKNDGEYVKYGTYFDRAYNEKINENDSDEQQRSSTQINLEIESQQKKRRSTAMDPPMIDRQPVNIERLVFIAIFSDEKLLTFK